MCLRKTHKKPKFLIFPKTVYKVLINNNGKFKTSYRETPVELGETYTGKFKDNRILPDTIDDIFIEDGFIHSFISLTAARRETLYHHNPCIVKCRIPAFTYYYKGKDEDIASIRLKYIKIID